MVSNLSSDTKQSANYMQETAGRFKKIVDFIRRDLFT